MATATCAECGATAQVQRNDENKLGIQHDSASMAAHCKNWPLPLEIARGSLGESPTGCPHLDQAVLDAIRIANH
jgi:hypothetical protein